MNSLLLLLISYAEIFFLIISACLMTIIFVKSRKKTTKFVWFMRAIVVTLLLLISVLDLFLLFTSGLTGFYDSDMVEALTQFISVLASIFFLVILVGRKHILKLI